MKERYSSNICLYKDETMTEQRISVKSEEETKALATTIASETKAGDVICLNGTLGAGKTAFSRYFVQSLLGGGTEVPSPTFTLVQTYDSSNFTIWHFDLYRLEDPEEVYELGWEDALSDGVLLIEWPEKAGDLIPPQAKEIYIVIEPDKSRTFTIKGTGK